MCWAVDFYTGLGMRLVKADDWCYLEAGRAGTAWLCWGRYKAADPHFVTSRTGSGGRRARPVESRGCARRRRAIIATARRPSEGSGRQLVGDAL